MTQTAQSRAPDPIAEEDATRAALLAALRVAHARAKIVLLNIEDIGAELKAGRISPRDAMRLCMAWRIDSLFPRQSDGA